MTSRIVELRDRLLALATSVHGRPLAVGTLDDDLDGAFAAVDVLDEVLAVQQIAAAQSERRSRDVVDVIYGMAARDSGRPIEARGDAEVAQALAAGVSTLLRSPLTAVLGFADLLLDSGLSESERLNHVMTIRRNGEYLLEIIDEMLDLSKLVPDMALTRIECSLADVVGDVVSLMQVRASDRGISFEAHYETQIPDPIYSDPKRLRQILINIVGSAMEYSDRGSIRLLVRCADLHQDYAQLIMTIECTSVSMTNEELESLLRPLREAEAATASKYAGTGIGLAIAATLCDALGGQITASASSSPGSGAAFMLSLAVECHPDTVMVRYPTARGTFERDANKMRGEREQFPSGTVLLVEDGIDSQILLATMLRKRGLHVVVADSGQRGRHMVGQAVERGAPYDVILIDMQVQDIGGYDVITALREDGSDGLIIAITNHAAPGEHAVCLDAGGDGLINKPLDAQTLLHAIAQFLRSRPKARAG